MVIQVEKLTVSVPKHLIKVTDEIARERKISRSKVVSACLQELAERRFHEKMAEGYRKMAKDSLTFARGTLHIARKTLPEWE